MKASIREQLRRRKRRTAARLRQMNLDHYGQPVLRASNIQYEIAERNKAISAGGIGAIHLMVQKLGLPEVINQTVPLLKLNLPYTESDHVLNIAYNLLAGGTRMEHIDKQRQDEVFLDALGAQRIPDPTTARDFCQRFDDADVLALMEAFNEVRLKVWSQQPEAFFEEAVLDADGTIAATTGQCKQGMERTYDGQWGFHPLVLSLSNTHEPLYLVNRAGNRPSHEDAYLYYDRAIALCLRGGFRRITLRGDTDFSQTTHLDRWDQDARGVHFRLRRPTEFGRLGGSLATRSLEKAGTAATRAGGPATRATGKRQTRAGRGPRVRELADGGGVRGGVPLSSDGLPAGVSDGGDPKTHLGPSRPAVSNGHDPDVLSYHQQNRAHRGTDRAGSPGIRRSLQSRERHRPTEKRSPGNGHADQQSGEQWGLYGDGLAGLDAEGVVWSVVTRRRAMGGTAAGRET